VRPTDHALHDLRVERRPTARHAPDGIDEQRQITHTVLEQIADALRSRADQVEGVAVLEELGEHHDPHIWLPRADLLHCSQTVVGQIGRHLDVGDYDVGVVGAGLAQQVLGVARHPDDLEPGLLEHVHDALSDQRLIFADDDADTSGLGVPPV
jgi:hypothetical protein